jgi:hypothetical protein
VHLVVCSRIYLRPMDSATAAALIGAGTASVIAVGSQFLADHLARARDLRNQKRERLMRVIVEAAECLYKPDDDERRSKGELDTADMHPESIAARDPERYQRLLPVQVAVSRGMTLLQIHFGHDDPLVGSYVDAATFILEVENDWFDHLRSDDEEMRIKAIPEMADALRAAQIRRDGWMQEARSKIEAT